MNESCASEHIDNYQKLLFLFFMYKRTTYEQKQNHCGLTQQGTQYPYQCRSCVEQRNQCKKQIKSPRRANF